MLGTNHLRRAAVVCAVVAIGCGASVTFNAAVNDVNLNFRAELPPDTSIPSVPCASQTTCDAVATDEITFTCTGGFCDPDPIVVEQTIADVNFEELASGVLTVLDSLVLKRATYDFSQNTLPVDVGPIEIYWGPASATSVDSPGVVLFGTFPAVPGNTTPEGEIALDASGNDALSDYVKNTSVDVRFFARGSVDLEPGDQIPADSTVEASFVFTIKATGKLL